VRVVAGAIDVVVTLEICEVNRDIGFSEDYRTGILQSLAPDAVTEEDFLGYFDSRLDAGEFERSALSIGRDLLPESALTVLEGGDATPGYWSWLIDQVEAQANAWD